MSPYFPDIFCFSLSKLQLMNLRHKQAWKNEQKLLGLAAQEVSSFHFFLPFFLTLFYDFSLFFFFFFSFIHSFQAPKTYLNSWMKGERARNHSWPVGQPADSSQLN